MLSKLRSKAAKDKTAPAPEVKPSRRVAFHAAKGSRYVLIIGDEGAILIYMKHNTVLSRQFVPDSSEGNLEEFRQTLAKDPKAPLILVADSMDQTYVQQTLPPVSSMSVGKLIRRRLDRDFGPNDIKNAVVLGREKGGRKDWNFMMIALERSPQLSVWLEFVLSLSNRFAGIHLISVEAESIVKNLERAIGVPKQGTGSEWKFFVSHNKVGGFRQVILRGGRIIFTRLAQPLADANTEVIAGSIEQEMQSTIEYMKRLSYTPQSGLDVYILASSHIRDAIDVRKFNATNVKIYTPFEMAGVFGIEGATQESDQFGDVVLAAIIGATRKHVLTLRAPEYTKIDTYYRLIMVQRLLAALLVLGMVGYAVYAGIGIMGLSGELEKIERNRQAEQNTLSALKAEIARTNLDVDKATDLIDLYKQLQKENASPLPFIDKIRPLLAPPVSLKSLEWTLSDAKSLTADPTSPIITQLIAKGGKVVVLNLVLELPPVANDRKARRLLMTKLLTDFRAKMPGFDVKSDESALANDDSLNFKSSSDKAPDALPNPLAAQPQQAPVAVKFTFTGPLVEEKPPAPSPAAPAPAATGGAP